MLGACSFREVGGVDRAAPAIAKTARLGAMENLLPSQPGLYSDLADIVGQVLVAKQCLNVGLDLQESGDDVGFVVHDAIRP